jgi:hypothetical protein
VGSGYLTAATHVERQQRPSTPALWPSPSSVMRGKSTKEDVVVSARTFLVSSPPLPLPLEVPPSTKSESQPDADSATTNPVTGPGGRERRARKSINYAESKLNPSKSTSSLGLLNDGWLSNI